MRIVLNGKEVTNPFVRGLFGLLAFVIFGVLILLLLPLIGITLALSIGIIALFFAAMLTVVILALLFNRRRTRGTIRIIRKDDRR